jgi:hypothetical protein
MTLFQLSEPSCGRPVAERAAALSGGAAQLGEREARGDELSGGVRFAGHAGLLLSA